MIKAIIVDDEPPARREMRRLLSKHPDLTVAGEAGDIATARGLASRTRPDLVFLDVRLGRENGFDLLPDLDAETSVVFVTAYDSYAVTAFEANAIDYLMKPVEASRLDVALARVRASRNPDLTPTGDSPNRPFTRRKWIFLEAGESVQFLRTATISHIQASEGAVTVHTIDGKSHATAKPLASWEQKLDPDDFVRVHRSVLINLSHVQRIERWFQYSYRVYMAGSREPVPMSRRYAVTLRDRLG